MPNTPKCFYQYGARIVGWSRVAQVVVMELVAPHIENIICGDTDSLKLYFKAENISKIEKELKRHARALDKAKKQVCARVKYSYPLQYDELAGIGHYVYDGEYQAFSASWNKSYIGLVDGKHKLTIAGVPTSRTNEKNGSYNDFCDELAKNGLSFDEIASLAIGYNVTIHPNITKLNARVHPAQFGEWYEGDVVDYLGNKAHVRAPAALALHPGVKTIGDTCIFDNNLNMEIAKRNNPDLNISPVMLKWVEGKPIIERW